MVKLLRGWPECKCPLLNLNLMVTGSMVLPRDLNLLRKIANKGMKSKMKIIFAISQHAISGLFNPFWHYF